MDINSYKNLKKIGNITLKSIGDQVACEMKAFDSTTGVEINPTVSYLNKENLDREKSELLARIEVIDEILQDIEDLKKKEKEIS